MDNIYLKEFESVAKLSFSMWNREQSSFSFGSFDRLYWGWKFKDISEASLQYGVKLAVEYAASIGCDHDLPVLLDGYVKFCSEIQLGDGSFDQCYPNERTPGVIYDILSTLIYVRKSPYLTQSSTIMLLDDVIKKAVSFAMSSDEKHGEVANHLAGYAYELLNYSISYNDSEARLRCDQYIKRLIDNFNVNEGWFLEYNGPDAGYQTRCLRYLVKIAVILESDELWAIIKQAATFVSELLMPDGSVHPMLGVRSTALLYPSAFEMLAQIDPNFQGLAECVHQAWMSNKVPLPSQLDFGNAIRLADDAAEAHQIRLQRKALATNKGNTRPLCLRTMPDAGIHILSKPNYIVYLSSKLGGVIVIYAISPKGEWNMVYEDSGYILKSKRYKEVWLTRMPNSGKLVNLSQNNCVIEASFHKSLHDEVTPFRLLVLRILNLTLLRFQFIGDIFRKLVVNKLMSGIRTSDLKIRRELVFLNDEVVISDFFEAGSRLETTQYELMRCRRAVGNHMATSRYFQEQELLKLPLGWLEQQEWPFVKNRINRITISMRNKEDL